MLPGIKTAMGSSAGLQERGEAEGVVLAEEDAKGSVGEEVACGAGGKKLPACVRFSGT